MKPLAQNTLIQNRYLIVQLIGKGGMGEVYLAVDQRLGSAVALKRTYFAGDDTLGSAFEREARVLARLRHPVLPKVSDHFGEGDEQFLVMEHISGDDLSIRLEAQQKAFPLSWVMFWADQLLDALSYLHSHEPPIIHRDIKPQNLKLTDENHIILLDFGLSKTSTGMTNISGGASTGSTGSVVGYTPHYAPMEQIRGIGTSARSDLYSLSATLYQLMTNTVPPDALTRADTMLNGLPDPITSPSDLNPEVSPAISEVVLKGMEVSQEKRYENAREMQKALRRAFSEMQQAMSAKTMVISADEIAGNGTDQTPNFDATEVMSPADLASASTPIQNPTTPGRLLSLPTPDIPVSNVDLNATIAYDSSSVSQPEPLKQADVKTEVFTGGMLSGTSEPAPMTDQYGGSGGGRTDGHTPGTSLPGEYESGPATEDWGASSAASPEPSGYSPEATVPLIAFEGGHGAADGTSSFADGSPGSEPVHADPVFTPSEDVRPVTKPPAKKSSTGKIIAILGGLFLFFVVILAAAGGGYYYYANYYLPGLEPTPTPSPEPTLEPSPTPEVTPSLASDTNTNTNSNSLSESSPTPTPTATPVEEPSREPETRPDRPDRRPSTEKPPTRPKNTKTPKPVPTKKSGTDILQ